MFKNNNTFCFGVLITVWLISFDSQAQRHDYYKPTPINNIGSQSYADAFNGEPKKDQINWMVWGHGRNAVNNQLSSWNIGDFTGAKVPEPLSAYQRTASTTGYGGMAVEMHNDPQIGPVFGTIINTFSEPWIAGQANISAGILEYDFSNSAQNIFPFQKPNTSVHFSMKMQVPQAYVLGGSRAHISPSITFDDTSTGQYFWYAPLAFNMGPGQWPSELISWDIGTQSAIVGSHYGNNTKYITTSPGSSFSTAQTWKGWRTFAYSVNAAQLLLAIEDVNRYKKQQQNDCIKKFQTSTGRYPTPDEIEKNCPNKDFNKDLSKYKIGSFLMDAEVARPNSANDNGNLGYSVNDIYFYSITIPQNNPPAEPIHPGAVSIFPEGGFENPRFRFGNGQATNTQMDFLAGLPDIAGLAQSPWYIAQWKKTDLLRPDVMFRSPASVVDPVFKVPLYAFPTPSNESHIYAFKELQSKKMVYELYGEHGWLNQIGGSNVFLSVNAQKPSESTFEKPLLLQIKAKVSNHQILYNSEAAKKDGSVLTQFFSGFTVQYRDPKTSAVSNLFLQIYHGGSTANLQSHQYRGCYRNNANSSILELVYGANLNDAFFKDASPNGPLQSVEYNVNKYLCDMISKPIKCTDGSQNWDFVFPPEARNLKNWNINSYYIGIETQDRLGSATAAPRGAAAMGVQLSDIKLMKQSNQADYVCNSSNPTPLPPETPASSGKFCSGKNEILWQCGLTKPPTSKWTSQGGECYHFNNGKSSNCK